ncbi:MAG: sulfatase-like hydrolase/transferase, partial [Planctomycetaceae bacterium]
MVTTAGRGERSGVRHNHRMTCFPCPLFCLKSGLVSGRLARDGYAKVVRRRLAMRMILRLLLIGGMVGCGASNPVDASSATGRSATSTAKAPLQGDPSSARRQRPNVVVLLADDLGSKDIGCDSGPVKTPTLDKLAAKGVRFTDFHSGAPVCSPARATLLTGRHHL